MSRLREAQRCIANQLTYKNLNAFINVPTEDAVYKAAEAEDRSGNASGSLAGRLIAIKDNICTKHLPTTAASGILKSFVSPYDATVIRQLQAAGAIIAGKTNMDEFGMGSHSIHSYFGQVSQEEGNSAGGSSGGSAVAVATGQCWAALGTDTGGSVRLPAAYTGIVGFKPSYGLLSRWGVIAYANSLDTVGILANDIESTKNIFDLLNVYDPSDPTSLRPSTRSRIQERSKSRKPAEPLRIGVPIEYNIHSLSPLVRDTWIRSLAHFKKAGHTLHQINLPTTRQALSAYYVLAPAEASSNLAKYDGIRYGTRAAGPDGTGGVLYSQTRGQGFGDEVKRRILLGAYSLSSKAIDNYFIQAQRVRRLVQSDFNRAFRLRNPLLESEAATEDGVDVIIAPTAPTEPPAVEDVARQTPIEAYMNDVFTVPASLAGLPALSVPFEGSGKSEKNIGVQIMGQFGDDQLVLEAGILLSGLN